MTGPQKHPAPHDYIVRRGVAGARARWGPPHRVKIADLPPNQRALIAALVDLARDTKETGPTNETSGPVMTEGHGNVRPSV